MDEQEPSLGDYIRFVWVAALYYLVGYTAGITWAYVFYTLWRLFR
jgi:hypothetical protein